MCKTIMELMGWRKHVATTVALSMFLVYCHSQDASTCNMATSCAECISTGPSCGWCAQRDYFSASCDLSATLLMSNCSDVQNPEPYSVNITKDEALSNAGDAPLGQAVQIKPQEIHLKIRRGETARLRMNVRQAEDYPVDMYFLMDLSESMKDDLRSLVGIANDLVVKMQELTRNFRVGFGSFIDKVVIPFAAIKDNGDPIICEDCDQPYTFKNGLSLTNNTGLFEQTLIQTRSSRSKDKPEAGLFALLQAAVCSDVIGWRENSRHLIVYLTDAPFHVAGDGRLGGIVTPNDGECHVDPSTGIYTIDKAQDYPSVGQLSSVVLDKNIVVMFVVTSEVQQNYRDILSFFPGSQTGTLAPSSENLVYWIENLYNKITGEVTLSVQAPEELLLDFTAYCYNNDIDAEPNTKSCDGLAIGDEVYFDIDVTAESCIDGSSTSFSVSPIGFSEELLVHVELTCSCDCEEQGMPNSPECNYNGTNQCGMCACNVGRYGDTCQCSGDSASSRDDTLACIAPGATSVCSGRGECICGECVCNIQNNPTHVVSGHYCQCDNFNCPLFEGELCGGPSRGTCVCDPESQQSKCLCTSEYEGDSCNCLKSQEACISPNGLICNSHGTCTCGACRCEIDSPFKGTTCFDCATCAGQCEVYQECVQCKAFNSGPLTDLECDMCSVEVIKVEKFPDVEYPYNCSVNHIDNCSIVFIPYFENGMDSVPVIYVLDSTVCPPVYKGPGVDARWVAVGLAIAIVLIGIILIIIYKAYITYMDRKEYREWEKEKANAQFGQNENPIYKPAQTRHQNPAYGAQFSDPGESIGLQEKS